jgi:hypothetical protein
VERGEDVGDAPYAARAVVGGWGHGHGRREGDERGTSDGQWVEQGLPASAVVRGVLAQRPGLCVETGGSGW